MSISPKYNVIPGIDDQANDALKDMHFRIPDIQNTTVVPTKQASVGSQRLIADPFTSDPRLFIRHNTEWREYQPIPKLFIEDFGLTFLSVNQINIGTGKATDSTGKQLIVSDNIITVDLSQSGLNGLDRGSEAADTWYAVHAIGSNDLSKKVFGLLSLSETNPTLPEGYDIFRFLGYVRNNVSSDILAFSQFPSGNLRTYRHRTAQVDRFVLSNGSATVPTAINFASLVPPSSTFATVRATQNAAKIANFFDTIAGTVIVFSLTDKDATVLADIFMTPNKDIFYAHDNAGGKLDIIIFGWVETI